MINAGLPMATPDMAQISNAVGSLPADPQETALRQYLQQLQAQGQAGSPQYLIAGGELQNRQNMRDEAQANQAAGVQQMPPVMQQLAQPQPQIPQQPPRDAYPQSAPSAGPDMQSMLGGVPPVQQGIMNMSQAGGIETLPADNLQNIENYAGGGIVAFDEGGEVPGFFKGKFIASAFGKKEDPALDERIRGLYDQGITNIPTDFLSGGMGSGPIGGLKGIFRKLTQDIRMKDAQNRLSTMWENKNKSDIADYFKQGVRLDEEDVKKYGLGMAGGGEVRHFFGGGDTMGGFDLNAASSNMTPFVPNFLSDEAKLDFLRKSGKFGLSQVKDLQDGRVTLDDLVNEAAAFVSAPTVKPVKVDPATGVPPAVDPNKKDLKGSPPPSPAPDATMTGIAALTKELQGLTEEKPSIADISKERLDYYKSQGIGGDPYAKMMERAQKEASPDKSKADKNRLLWETVLGIGQGIGTAGSKQKNKRAQFLEDLTTGIAKGTEKLPERLREVEMLERERNKALEDVELAKFNFTKSGADADLKRLDDKQTKLEAKNLKILEMRTNLSVEGAKAAGLKDYRASDQDKDLWVAAQKAATDFFSKDPKALTDPASVLPKIRSLAVQFYNDSKTRGAGTGAPVSSIDTSKWGDPKVKK